MSDIPDDTITIPYNWIPYDHQLEAFSQFQSGKRKQYHIWHRRAGKDNLALNIVAAEALLHSGVYWIVYPTQTHARSAVWHNIDSDGIRMIDHVFPKGIVKRINDNEMLIELINGSIVKLMAADSDKLVGANPIGVVFSEWALCNPSSYEYVRPILKVNKGWVIFITTYRGKNHAYTMYQKLKTNPDWYCTTKTIDDTGILDEADMLAERAEGMDEALLQQEYYCSPMAAFQGAYFSKEMREMHDSNRLTTISYDPSLPVYCCFDLGHSGRGDLTVCSYIQDSYNTPRVISSQSWRVTSIPEIVRDIRKLPWAANAILLLPHDGAHYEIGTGKSRLDMFKEQHNWVNAEYITRIKNIQDGIEQLRQMLSVAVINNAPDEFGGTANFTLIEALHGFRAKPNNDLGTYSSEPLHSWESDWVASLRTYAGWRSGHGNTIKKKYKVLDYSRLNRAAFQY